VQGRRVTERKLPGPGVTGPAGEAGGIPVTERNIGSRRNGTSSAEFSQRAAADSARGGSKSNSAWWGAPAGRAKRGRGDWNILIWATNLGPNPPGSTNRLDCTPGKSPPADEQGYEWAQAATRIITLPARRPPGPLHPVPPHAAALHFDAAAAAAGRSLPLLTQPRRHSPSSLSRSSTGGRIMCVAEQEPA
jgi:hypothetical protein